MYFLDRVDAGKKLAAAIKGQLPIANRTVVALSDGAVVVGDQIARAVHASMLILKVEKITLPGELQPMAALNQGGSLTYNSAYSAGEITEFNEEYNSFIQEERMHKFFLLNRNSGKNPIKTGLLKKHVVILVADGLSDGFLIDAAADYLKPFKMNMLVIATPFASVKAVDRMHLLADKIFCLDIIDNYLDTDHYYENNDLPDPDQMSSNIETIALRWHNPRGAEPEAQ